MPPRSLLERIPLKDSKPGRGELLLGRAHFRMPCARGSLEGGGQLGMSVSTVQSSGWRLAHSRKMRSCSAFFVASKLSKSHANCSCATVSPAGSARWIRYLCASASPAEIRFVGSNISSCLTKSMHVSEASGPSRLSSGSSADPMGQLGTPRVSTKFCTSLRCLPHHARSRSLQKPITPATRLSMSTWFSPGNRGLRFMSSTWMQPTDHRSTASK
mmetsp:Transcript_37891/g.82546  ORF Transcript_37891/g.82546 Transcript_37891/m.82546 type:complete len:215 (-) Transcript_37891:718-1362(-)